MPLYDCVMLMKPHLKKETMMDLIARVGKHVYARNGVLTDIKPVENVQLGYGIKKLDGRYFQGQLVQMTMMATPDINKELHYLNKDDRLLRWLLVKHRGNVDDKDGKSESKFSRPRTGLDFLADDEGTGGLGLGSRVSIYGNENEDEDEAEYDDDYDDEAQADGEKERV